MEKAKEAFLNEAGIGLINEYAGVEDELFTAAGLMLMRMMRLSEWSIPFA